MLQAASRQIMSSEFKPMRWQLSQEELQIAALSSLFCVGVVYADSRQDLAFRRRSER